MPTYQYACTECGHGFEAVQSFTDASLTECPACAGRLRKVFGSVGVVFKGSGFYRNDSREAAKAAANGGKANGKGEAESGGAKSDSAKSDGSKSDGAKTDKPASSSSPKAGSGSAGSSNGSSSTSSSGKSSSTAGSAA